MRVDLFTNKDSNNDRVSSAFIVAEWPGTPAGYDDYQARLQQPGNVFHPFSNEREWEFARWAKLHGPSATSLDELLSTPDVRGFCAYLSSPKLIHFVVC